MPGYLPLCASRQDMLPPVCRSCAWWQTPGNGQHPAPDGAEQRHRWMLAAGSRWGSLGLLRDSADLGKRFSLQSTRSIQGCSPESSSPTDRGVMASIHYAPAATIPRLGSLPFAPTDQDAVLLFCLWSEEARAGIKARQLLQKALGQLKDRGIQEVYAYAGLVGSTEDEARCQFFPLDFLESNGFQQVTDNSDIYLMRADLRGLLSLINQVESALKRVLKQDPTPSPAAWTRRA